MAKKRLVLMIFMTLSISGCTVNKYSVSQACSISPSQLMIKLNLSKDSTIKDYQSALITRKAEVKLRDRDIDRIKTCVDELTRTRGVWQWWKK
jgi:hypothetical protein